MSEQVERRDGTYAEQEWGVRYGQAERVHSCGTGYWAMRHAEQDVERVKRNASLPSVGQPREAEVVQRIVTRYYDASPWSPSTDPNPPAPEASAGVGEGVSHG